MGANVNKSFTKRVLISRMLHLFTRFTGFYLENVTSCQHLFTMGFTKKPLLKVLGLFTPLNTFMDLHLIIHWHPNTATTFGTHLVNIHYTCPKHLLKLGPDMGKVKLNHLHQHKIQLHLLGLFIGWGGDY